MTDKNQAQAAETQVAAPAAAATPAVQPEVSSKAVAYARAILTGIGLAGVFGLGYYVGTKRTAKSAETGDMTAA